MYFNFLNEWIYTPILIYFTISSKWKLKQLFLLMYKFQHNIKLIALNREKNDFNCIIALSDLKVYVPILYRINWRHPFHNSWIEPSKFTVLAVLEGFIYLVLL